MTLYIHTADIASTNGHNGVLPEAIKTTPSHNGNGECARQPSGLHMHYSKDMISREDYSPEREFHNPIYGGGTSEAVYTDPHSFKGVEKEQPEGEEPGSHEFDNPLYGCDRDTKVLSLLTEDPVESVVITRKGTGHNVYENSYSDGKVSLETSIDCDRDYDCID